MVQSDKLSTDELVAKLSNQKNIKYAEPNYRIKAFDIGDYSKYQWAIDNKGQNGGTVGFDVNPEAVSADGESEEECVIALVDTGIDYTHPDLADVVWNNPYESSKFKGAHGYDFINMDDDPLDDNGHGSHCSGIMAASKDEKGITGVATSENIKIMALKMLDAQGYGYGMEAVGAYNYIYKAQCEGVNVVAVNNSWGGVGAEESYILMELINLVGDMGAVSVCAAGNSAEDNDVVESLPANLESDYIISVAASDENDKLASFSCYGANSVDIAAPGTDILSSVSYDCFNPGIYENKDEMCAWYEDFTDGELVQVLEDDSFIKDMEDDLEDGDIPYGMNKGGNATVEVSITGDRFFGEDGDNEKSVQINVKNAKKNETYDFFFPYTVSADNKKPYTSAMASVKGPDGGDNIVDGFFIMPSQCYVSDAPLTSDGAYDMDNEVVLNGTTMTEDSTEWFHASNSLGKAVKAGQQRTIVVTLFAGADGNYTINVDNIGISKAGVSPEQFGKYDYYNGTSMATPQVTGAVAALANANPDEDAMERKGRVLGSTRYSAALEGKVSTASVLDLSKAKAPNMSVSSLDMNCENRIEVYGSYLNGAKVFVNG